MGRNTANLKHAHKAHGLVGWPPPNQQPQLRKTTTCDFIQYLVMWGAYSIACGISAPISFIRSMK